MVVKDNVGVIEQITAVKSKEIKWNKDGKEETATIYEIGIKLGDGSWHNISNGNQAKAEEVLKDMTRNNVDFVVGDEVKIYSEDKKGSGYYKVTGICLVKAGSGGLTTTNQTSPQAPVNSRDEYFRKKDAAMTRLGCLKDALLYIEIQKDLGQIKEVSKDQLYALANEFLACVTGEGEFKRS